MSYSKKLWVTSIGRKILMAVTGVFLILFLIGHMLGNLQIFAGPEPINRYAAFLQGLGEMLWAVRLALLLALAIHVFFSIQLTLENWKARPVSYQNFGTIQASFASRTMIYTGALVFCFIVIHLLHYTMGILQPEHFHILDAKGRHDVYAMLIYGFQNPYYSRLYIILMVALGFHLSHAIMSACETLGFNHPAYSTCVHRISLVVGWGIACGYIIVPVSVWLGWLGLPAGGN